MSYEKLPIEQFGEHLLRTGDLDPIYIALHKMQLPLPQLQRWLIAYWCWYSAGVACHMSEQADADFWKRMYKAAWNEDKAPHGGRWERGKERRHARGGQGYAMVSDLASRYLRPGAMVDWLCETEEDETFDRETGETPLVEMPLPYSSVAAKVQSHTLFGPWISYKVCDMLERLGLAPIVFSEEDAMYEEPRKAAVLLCEQRQWQVGQAEDIQVRYVVSHLLNWFGDGGPDVEWCYTAPPRHERPVGLQEIETILCKWKSHMGGHYPLFNDIREIWHGLKPWQKWSRTARLFLDAMPGDTEVEL